MNRIRWFLFRLIDYIVYLPLRFWRLFMWITWIRRPMGKNKIVRWLAGILMHAVDLTPLPLFVECLMEWFKVSTRPLQISEREKAIWIFGKSIPLHLITLDPSSIVVKKKITMAYTLFHTLNFRGQLPDETLIHELVHVWQYRQYGSLYITESLWAQRWGGGYNYGGADVLKMQLKKGIRSINFEQQAEIIEDYYRWLTDGELQWISRDPGIEKILLAYGAEVYR